ncbi:MAG: hypothetical protein ACSHWR_03030 [Psychromonas sp.]
MNIKRLLIAAVVGIISSVIFIIVQPWLGMSTLTSRHASAYVNLGGYDPSLAVVIAWCVHVSVSVAYAQLSSIIFNINDSMKVNVIQVLFFGWLTTLIATPANELVVKLVTTQQFPKLTSLQGLNFEVGPKLWLHLLFFVFVIIGLMMSKRINRK